jgi:hypothetical protein
MWSYNQLPAAPDKTLPPASGPTQQRIDPDQKQSASATRGGGWDCWCCWSTPGPTSGADVVVAHHGSSMYCCLCSDNCCSSPAPAHATSLSSHISSVVPSSGCCCRDISCCLNCNDCDCNCDCVIGLLGGLSC